MIDYSALYQIFGNTLPEAHTFFATRSNKYATSYASLRRDLGMTRAKTNRSVWLAFVAKYAQEVKPVSVTGVSLSPKTQTIKEGVKLQLVATISPEKATNKKLTYSSNNSAIASVSSTGEVTGGGTSGSAVITVTTEDGKKTDTSVIQNQVSVTGVTVTPTNATLNKGGTQQLTPTVLPIGAYNKKVTYTSTDSNIVTVNTSGLVTAKGAGSASVTITTEDGGKTAVASFMVKVPVTGLTMTPTTATLAVNGTQQMTTTVSPSDATTKAVTYSSSNPTVATVSTGGVVTAKAAGTTTITVTAADGSNKTATATITVS